MIRRLPCVFVIALVLAATASAQDEEAWDLSVGGVALGRFSAGVAQDSGLAEGLRRIGFGIRQAQVRGSAARGRAGVVGSLNLGNGTAFVQSLFAFYEPTLALRFRLGRIPTPKPVGTPLPLMDDVDRSATETLWAARTIGGHGHDFGLEARYHRSHTTATFMLHNGDGDWSGLRGDYTSFIQGGGATGGIQRLGMAASLGLAVRGENGLAVGGFAGVNGSRNPNTARDGIGRRYASVGGHVHWGARPGSQPVRLKLDVSGLWFDETDRPPADPIVSVGLFGAVRVARAAEAFARMEQDGDLRQPDARFVSFGASVSPSARRGGRYPSERLTVSHRARLRADGSADHLAVLQLQLAF